MKISVRKLVFAALCTAIGLLLPTVFHTFGISGTIFLPMHIPVLLCGFICGWQYGVLCGIVVPLLCSVLTGRPPLFPVGVAMIFELATYGMLTGLLKDKCSIYIALIGAMLGGRIINGSANVILMGMLGNSYTMQAFLSGAFITALPGIIIQLIVIPALVYSLNRAGVTKQIENQIEA